MPVNMRCVFEAILLLAFAFVRASASVRCECMAKAVDAAGTSAAYTIGIDYVFGPVLSCRYCRLKCELQINKCTNHGDLNTVPLPIFNQDKLGTLICRKTATDLNSTKVQLYSICNDGTPELCNFHFKNPRYLCCKNGVWPDAVSTTDRCPPIA